MKVKLKIELIKLILLGVFTITYVWISYTSLWKYYWPFVDTIVRN